MEKEQIQTANFQENKPAIVTIGDELLLGEQSNGNQTWMATVLAESGFPAHLAISLPDKIQVIGQWISRLRKAEYHPIFVSGGIGGTHDDCTRDGIAAGLNVSLSPHKECHQILSDKYGSKFSQQRQRMAFLPENCSLIPNPIGAPGFYLDGVYAFPGFPSMLKPMLRSMLPSIFRNTKVQPFILKEVVLPLAESDVAAEIETFVKEHPETKIGIYPSDENLGKELTIRMRMRTSDSSPALSQLFDELIKTLSDKCS